MVKDSSPLGIIAGSIDGKIWPIWFNMIVRDEVTYQVLHVSVVAIGDHQKKSPALNQFGIFFPQQGQFHGSWGKKSWQNRAIKECIDQQVDFENGVFDKGWIIPESPFAGNRWESKESRKRMLTIERVETQEIRQLSDPYGTLVTVSTKADATYWQGSFMIQDVSVAGPGSRMIQIDGASRLMGAIGYDRFCKFTGMQQQVYATPSILFICHPSADTSPGNSPPGWRERVHVLKELIPGETQSWIMPYYPPLRDRMDPNSWFIEIFRRVL